MFRVVAPVPPEVTGRAVVSESEPSDAVVAKRLVVVAVPKYPVPLAVKFVVDAPPFIERRPAVMVEEAFDRKPLVKVVRPLMPNVPRFAVCEKRFVELAVVAKKLVVVPAVSESVPAVSAPRFAFVEKRLVDEAVVENRLVVVAFPPTAVWNVRLVVDAVTAPSVDA